jgi:hypothetical protein
MIQLLKVAHYAYMCQLYTVHRYGRYNRLVWRAKDVRREVDLVRSSQTHAQFERSCKIMKLSEATNVRSSSARPEPPNCKDAIALRVAQSVENQDWHKFGAPGGCISPVRTGQRAG